MPFGGWNCVPAQCTVTGARRPVDCASGESRRWRRLCGSSCRLLPVSSAERCAERLPGLGKTCREPRQIPDTVRIETPSTGVGDDERAIPEPFPKVGAAKILAGLQMESAVPEISPQMEKPYMGAKNPKWKSVSRATGVSSFYVWNRAENRF